MLLFGLAKINVPIFAVGNALLGHKKIMAGLQLTDVTEDRLWRWDILKRKVIGHSALIQHARHRLVLDDRFQLRTEDKLAVDIGVIERLFAYAIARQQHPPVSLIPDGEREHATKHRDTSLAKIFVKMNDSFSVRIGF